MGITSVNNYFKFYVFLPTLFILTLFGFSFTTPRYGGSYVGNVPVNTRLKIPAINLEDGPQVC
jgi:hypothetical protein